jgi:hypothetical protein
MSKHSSNTPSYFAPRRPNPERLTSGTEYGQPDRPQHQRLGILSASQPLTRDRRPGDGGVKLVGLSRARTTMTSTLSDQPYLRRRPPRHQNRHTDEQLGQTWSASPHWRQCPPT